MREVPDPYRILGVRRDATEGEVKAAHRRLAKRYHPDAPEGDTDRFLAVQEAYRVLSDATERGEWDRRHAAGPIRADDARARRDGARGERRRAGPARPASTAGSTASEDTASPAPQGGRNPGGGSYTWSAREVPWWEDPLAPREARRPPGRRRPAGTATGREREGATPAGAADDATEGRPAAAAPGDAGERATRDPAGEPLRPEMDVYSRSSGAAWSQAARAYFRRHDLPPPGRRSAWQGRAAAGRGEPATASPRATPPPRATRAGTDAPARDVSPGAGTRSARPSPPRGDAASARSATRRSGPSPAPPAGRGGEARATATASTATSAARRRSPGAAARRPFPTLAERVALAAIAWVPAAIVIAYGGGAVSGCGRAAAACSPLVAPIQLGLAAAAFIALLAAPRVSWFAAAGSVAMLAAGFALLFALAAVGVDLALAGAAFVAVSVAIYALVVFGATRDRPLPRPWRTRPARGGGARA